MSAECDIRDRGKVEKAFAAAVEQLGPDPRARRLQRARRRERGRCQGRSVRRPRRDESERHVLLLPLGARPPRAGPRGAAPGRALVDPGADRRAGVHGVQRLEGRPARARAVVRRRARGGQRAGERDLSRLGRHRDVVGRPRRHRGREPAGRARMPTATRCGPCRSGGCRSRTTSPAPSRGSCRRTRAASPGRRSTRTAERGWGRTLRGAPARRPSPRDVAVVLEGLGLVLRVGGQAKPVSCFASSCSSSSSVPIRTGPLNQFLAESTHQPPKRTKAPPTRSGA